MLSDFLKNNKNARKVFGKKEIGILIKQLDGISLTQSEKNRLSRDIRPKLEVIKELSEFEAEFELKKDANNLRIIDKAIRLILQDKLKDRIDSILLFGSHMKGVVTKRSDIDIAVVFAHITLEEATRFRIRISGEFTEKVDIQVFNVLPQKIKRLIAGRHRILYKNAAFDNTAFSIKYLKDDDYFIRMNRIFAET